MAVKRLKSGSYQARFSISSSEVRTKTFSSRIEAEGQVVQWKKERSEGRLRPGFTGLITLDQFFNHWFKDLVASDPKGNETGWRKNQLQLYQNYVKAKLGHQRLSEIRPVGVQRVLNDMASLGRSASVRTHVYCLLHKMFRDGIEIYECASHNPVLRKLKPRPVQREARHLSLGQSKQLLSYVDGKPFGLAIWLQLYLGLRAGELLSLKWGDMDLDSGRVTIRRTLVKRLGLERDYPKGRKQHSHSIPQELLERMPSEGDPSAYVICGEDGKPVRYERYRGALKGYCDALGLPPIGTHGLRHSTSELYLSHGASRDDLRELFAHSTLAVTDRYIHGHGTNLKRVSNVIRLFPKRSNTNIEHDPVSKGPKAC